MTRQATCSKNTVVNNLFPLVRQIRGASVMVNSVGSQLGMLLFGLIFFAIGILVVGILVGPVTLECNTNPRIGTGSETYTGGADYGDYVPPHLRGKTLQREALSPAGTCQIHWCVRSFLLCPI